MRNFGASLHRCWIQRGGMPERNKLRTHPEEVRNERIFITSLARGLSLLETLADSDTPLTLTQLSRATDMSKATLTRFCHTLAELGYIEKTAAKRYQLTPKILGLGYGVICGYDLCQVAKPYLRDLSRTLGETVNMAVLEDTEILYVARYKTEQILATELHIGAKLPVYCTSMGKVILAHLPEDEYRSILRRVGWVPLTHNTHSSAEALLTELAIVRQQGFAVNDEELSVGLRSAAAPIFRQGRPIAAANVAVPTIRYTREALVSKLVPPLINTAKQISLLLEQQVGVQKV